MTWEIGDLITEYNYDDSFAAEIEYRMKNPDEMEESEKVYRYYNDDEEIEKEEYYDIIDGELKRNKRIDNKEPTWKEKKAYEKRHPHLKKKLLDEDELREHLNLDTFWYDMLWEDFQERLSEHIHAHNPIGNWETPTEDDTDDYGNNMYGSHHFNASDGKEFVDELEIDRQRSGGYHNDIKVFELGRNKDGMSIRQLFRDVILVLPECRGGFHRDWDNYGICVADEPED